MTAVPTGFCKYCGMAGWMHETMLERQKNKQVIDKFKVSLHDCPGFEDILEAAVKVDETLERPTLVKMADVSGQAKHWSMEDMLQEAVRWHGQEGFEIGMVLFVRKRTDDRGYSLRTLKKCSDEEAIAMLQCANTVEVRNLIGAGVAERVSTDLDNDPA